MDYLTIETAFNNKNMSLTNIKKHVQAVRQNKGILATDQLQLVTTSTVPTDSDLANGRLYYLTGTGLRMYVDDTWYTIPTSTTGVSGSTWDDIYAGDKVLTINDTTLTFAGSHASNAVLTITGSGTGTALQITNSSSGADVLGTGSTWSVSKAGAAVFTAVTGCDTLTAAANLAIDATGTGTVTIGGTSTGTVTITPALVATASLTITGSADTSVLVVTAGDMTIGGSITITENDTATYGLNITSSGTTGGAFHATCNDLAEGFMMILDSDNEASFGAGGYFECYDGTAAVFTIVANGLTTIAGNAGGTDAFVITAGDILLDDSDQNIIESENGTSTLLLLDNKAGAVGSGEAVLKVDAGGVVDAAGFGIYAAFTGAAAAGSTVCSLVPVAGTIGLFINGATTATREALKIDADPTAHDVALIHSDAVIAADKAVLSLTSAGAIASGGNVFRVDVTGAPASGAVYTEFDFAGLTDTNENVGVLIDAGGKKVQGLVVDADPVAGSVALFHTDGATADNKAVVEITSAGEPANAGANVLRVQFTGTATNTPTVVEIDGASKDVRSLSIDSDPTALDVAYIHTDAVIADNKAVLSLHSAGAMAAGSSILRLAQAGIPAAATSYTFEIDNTGSTTTNNAICMVVNNHTSTGAVIQATTAGAAAPLLDLYATHADAVGAVLKTYHNSATPADNDVVFSLQMWGMDDTHAEEWGRIEVAPLDVTTATSASTMKFYIDVIGTVETALVLKTNTAIVGAGSDHGYVTSSGAYNLVLNTNEGTNSGSITITDAANGDIIITPNGIGQTQLFAPALQVTDKTTTATLTIAEVGIITVNTTGAAFTVTLPAAATSAGAFYKFIKTDAAANALTIDGNGAETINGAATYAAIDAQYDTATVYCNGTAWYITESIIG